MAIVYPKTIDSVVWNVTLNDMLVGETGALALLILLVSGPESSILDLLSSPSEGRRVHH